jgi:hypothetical protein
LAHRLRGFGLDEKEAALKAWGRYLDALVEEGPDE